MVLLYNLIYTENPRRFHRTYRIKCLMQLVNLSRKTKATIKLSRKDNFSKVIYSFFQKKSNFPRGNSCEYLSLRLIDFPSETTVLLGDAICFHIITFNKLMLHLSHTSLQKKFL